MNEIIIGQERAVAMKNALEGKRFEITREKIDASYDVHEHATYGIELILKNEFKALGVSGHVNWDSCFVMDHKLALVDDPDQVGVEGRVPYGASMEIYYTKFPRRHVKGNGSIVLEDPNEVARVQPAIIEIQDGVLRCRIMNAPQ